MSDLPLSELPQGVELERSACPLDCQAADQVVVTGPDRLHGVPGVFTVVRCRGCGLMRTSPRPTPSTISAYYPGDYAPYSTASAAPASAGGWLRQLFALEGRRAPPIEPGHLLEIGCASGAYLQGMKAKGWGVSGIEFSEQVAQQARSKGIEVQSATVESARAPGQPVNMIAAWMVLEHLHEPVHALRRMRDWISPEGYLIGSVPDAGSLERRIFRSRWYALQLPTHLFHYDRRSLRRILAASGWKLTRLSWQRNCMNLLWSLEYVARDARMPRLERGVRLLRTSPRMGRARALLGWLLGITRQSGRLEFWAQPIDGRRASRP